MPCGKLERVDQMLVLDVFDVLTADDEHPAALAAAAGMLADNFHDSIGGARGAAGTRLGPEAAAAFQAHRYTRLEIDLYSDTLSIRKTISTGSLEPETYSARNTARDRGPRSVRVRTPGISSPATRLPCRSGWRTSRRSRVRRCECAAPVRARPARRRREAERTGVVVLGCDVW